MTQLRDYGRQIESDPILSAKAPVVDLAPRSPQPRWGRGLAWAVAAFVVILAFGGLYLAFSGADGQVVDQTTVPTPTTLLEHPPETEGVMWPQSSLNEVEEAQELADAGDPSVTWQLEPDLEMALLDTTSLEDPEIFARFLQEELGWEKFTVTQGVGFGDGTITITYVRCTPGETNSLYPNDQWGGECAPTIDDFRYETVAITVAQPARRGPTGLWVVSDWEDREPIEQVIPPTDAEATAILEGFLQARIEGEGAEQYFGGGDGTAQLLYATSTGAPYERFEYELVHERSWPDGGMGFEVRLFAEDGQTVVVQSFSLGRDGTGRWGLEAGAETFENGQALPLLHEVLGGEVTFQAGNEWQAFFGPSFVTNGKAADASLFHEAEGVLRVLADPLTSETGCEEGPAPADAAALAQSIRSNAEFETTAPVAVTVGGVPALQMDVVSIGDFLVCNGRPRLAVTRNELEPGHRMRLYLVDLPGGSARILSIAISAPDSDFDSVIEEATPVLDSFEFHTG
jgi:hypothetical protein